MSRLAEVFDDLGRRLPPVRGVIHAAGVLRDGLLVHQTWEEYKDVLAPKVTGAWNLHTLSRDLDLDFFVLFSSSSAVFGSPSQSSYAAANAFLDGLAAFRRSEGFPALSIAWGPWDEVGMAADLDPQQKARLTGNGVEFIKPHEGVEVMETLIRVGEAGPAAVAVLPIDWERIALSSARGGIPSLLQSELESRSLTAHAISDEDGLTDLHLLTPGEQRAKVEAMLCQSAATVLRLKPHSIRVNESLLNYGMDSLTATEFRNRIEARHSLKLPLKLILEGATISELAAVLAEQLAAPAGDAPRAGTSPMETGREEFVI